ncbi:hypothetical protein [Acidisoma sp. 7E03]
MGAIMGCLRRWGGRTAGTLLTLAAVMTGGSAQAQRVLECQFVSVQPSSFAYGSWSFAADISGGYLHMLLTRPPDAAPFATDYAPLRDGMSVHKAVPAASSDSGATAAFELATVQPGNVLVLDQWSFGGSESYDTLTLRCPSHR